MEIDEFQFVIEREGVALREGVMENQLGAVPPRALRLIAFIERLPQHQHAGMIVAQLAVDQLHLAVG